MNAQLLASEHLGMCGRMVCASKSAYASQHPTHTVVFNGNVCTKNGKIWFGDIDVTQDEGKLKALAEAIGEKIYVLYEMDARFDNEANPKLENAVWSS